MAKLRTILVSISFFTIILTAAAAESESGTTAPPPPDCSSEGPSGTCRNNKEALKLKIIAIVMILTTSAIGVCLPLFTTALPCLQPNGDLFALVKAFASGVILATGYMHVLPDSFETLSSDCLPDHPWKKFPFTTFVAMLSAVMTLMVDSFATSFYMKHSPAPTATQNSQQLIEHGHHGHPNLDDKASKLLRYRVIAQILEMGILVHSVIIGLSMGASDNPCTIRPLVAALCFHQLFEGMGLGGCILQAEYGRWMKSAMVFFFSVTTPFGIALGIGLSNVYEEDSPTALVVVGLLNACSAGLLNYMALVDLLAADFMGAKLQASYKLQACAYVAVLLGAGGMSLMAVWA